LNKCILALQIMSVESYLLRLFGGNVLGITPEEDSFRRFMSSDSTDSMHCIQKFQPYADVTITSPPGNLLCLLESVLCSSSSRTMLVSTASHYLRQCCFILNHLSSALLHGIGGLKVKVEAEVAEGGKVLREKEEEKYSFEANVELIYVLFKHVNMTFDVLLEIAYSRDSLTRSEESPSKKRQHQETIENSPLQQSVSVAKRSLLNNDACLSPATPGKTATGSCWGGDCSSGPSGGGGIGAASVEEVCSTFLKEVNEFKPILRKRMGAMGSTIEVGNILACTLSFYLHTSVIHYRLRTTLVYVQRFICSLLFLNLLPLFLFLNILFCADLSYYPEH